MCLLIFHTLLLYILSGLILPFCIDSSIVNGGRGGGGQDLADRGSHTEDGRLGCRWVELVTALK